MSATSSSGKKASKVRARTKSPALVRSMTETYPTIDVLLMSATAWGL